MNTDKLSGEGTTVYNYSQSDLFHTDGCVRANIRTKRYDVTIVGKCEHTKVRQAVITLDAETAADAVSFVQTWLRIPQTHVKDVQESPCKVCGSLPVWIHEAGKPSRYGVACGHD